MLLCLICNHVCSHIFPSLSTEANNLSGDIPNELDALEQLTLVDFDRNILLTGTIPATLGSLENLNTLNLENNMLSGLIPDSLFDADNLVRIDLDTNSLRGMLPTSIGNVMNLMILQIDGNMINGTLPSEIGLLENLGRFTRYTYACLFNFLETIADTFVRSPILRVSASKCKRLERLDPNRSCQQHEFTGVVSAVEQYQ